MASRTFASSPPICPASGLPAGGFAPHASFIQHGVTTVQSLPPTIMTPGVFVPFQPRISFPHQPVVPISWYPPPPRSQLSVYAPVFVPAGPGSAEESPYDPDPKVASVQQSRSENLVASPHLSADVQALLNHAFNGLVSGPYEQLPEVESRFRLLLRKHPETTILAGPGLARVLALQGGYKRYLQAKAILEQLKSDYPCRVFEGITLSGIPNLDFTLVRIYQGLGLLPTAYKLLRAISREASGKQYAADDLTLCSVDKYDQCRVRLLEDMGDNLSAEQLLQLMAVNCNPELQPGDHCTPCKEPTVDLGRMRLLEEMGLTRLSLTLLQQVIQSRPGYIQPPAGIIRPVPCGERIMDLLQIRLLEAEGDYSSAEAVLQAMAWNNPLHRANNRLVSCGDFELDSYQVRLLRKQGEHQAALTLLLSMAKSKTLYKELFDQQGKDVFACGHHGTDLLRANYYLQTGDEQRAKLLLRNIVSFRLSDEMADNWTISSDIYVVDMVRAQYLRLYGYYDAAEKLLTGLAILQSETPERQQTLFVANCTACGNHELDVLRVHVLHEQQKWLPAQQLLQSIGRLHEPELKDDELTRPCGHPNVDLLRVDHLLDSGDLKSAKALLQNMACGRNSALRQSDLAIACGHHAIDSKRVQMLERTGYYGLATTLLQGMAMNISPDLKQEDRLKLCGSADFDLTRARWLLRGRHYQDLREFSQACLRDYPFRQEFLELYLVSLGEQERWVELDQQLSQLPETGAINQNSPVVRLVQSISCFQQALHHYQKHTDAGNKSAASYCQQALTIINALCDQYPDNASALVQKGRCLRLLGRPSKEWQPLFRQAWANDPERFRYEQSICWQNREQQVLRQLSDQQSKSAAQQKEQTDN